MRELGVARVLVTGGAGYIGSHTCKALAASGFVPVTIDNLARGHRWAVKWGPFVEGDIADRELVRGVIDEFEIRAVIHFAAYAYVGESIAIPEQYFENNVAKTLALLDVARDGGVRRIVFSSTCATYGLPEKLPIDESHPQRPVNPYGDSKLFVERVLHWLDEAYDVRSTSLRYFNAAGADPDAEIGEVHEPETHLIPLALQAASGERPFIEVFGTDYSTPDGTAIRDYIHVADLAAAHVSALKYLLNGGASTALNLGTGRGYSVRQVIAAAERVAGTSISQKASARRPGDPPELVADASLARSVLNWVPELSDLDTIVETAWRWHRSQAADRTIVANRPTRDPQVAGLAPDYPR